MAGNELGLTRALVRIASAIDQVAVICDRTHEENLLADRQGREGECHYAFALGAIWQICHVELRALESAGIKRSESAEEANERALASLQAFRKSLRAEFGK